VILNINICPKDEHLLSAPPDKIKIDAGSASMVFFEHTQSHIGHARSERRQRDVGKADHCRRAGTFVAANARTSSSPVAISLMREPELDLAGE
jgi:hypothetical protein